MTAVLEVCNLTVQRGRKQLYQGFDCTLNKGECIWLRGRNGGGKTSLLLTTCGLLPPEDGEIRWNGQPLNTSNPELHTLWHYCAYQTALKDMWTIKENLQSALALAQHSYKTEQLHHYAEIWGLQDMLDQKASTLSQGQKRRAALLRLSLLPYRPVWLMDEPFDALDSNAQNLLAQAINRHIDSGGSVILTSHFQPPSLLRIHREINLDDMV